MTTLRPASAVRLSAHRAAGRAGLRALVVGLLAFGAGASPLAAQDVKARLQACGACHGADGNATLPNVPSLAGQPSLFVENQLVMIREGLREIPQMKGMLDGITDAEVTAIAAHYAGQRVRPAPSGPRDAARFDRGREQVAALRCGSCHQADLRGREQMPRLAGQREDYLLHSMRAFQNNQAVGRDTIMAATLYGVAPADLEAMAHFMAHSPP